MRLHDVFGWHIEDPLPVLPVIWLAEQGSVSAKMHRTFNMGMGMTVVVSKDVSESVEKWLNQRLPGSRYVGYVHD